jgi:hypothetical protein
MFQQAFSKGAGLVCVTSVSQSVIYFSIASFAGRLLGSILYQTAGMTILNWTILRHLPFKEVVFRTFVLVSTSFQRVDTFSNTYCVRLVAASSTGRAHNLRYPLLVSAKHIAVRTKSFLLTNIDDQQ